MGEIKLTKPQECVMRRAAEPRKGDFFPEGKEFVSVRKLEKLGLLCRVGCFSGRRFTVAGIAWVAAHPEGGE